MSKYDALWEWIRDNGSESLQLTYAQIEEHTGVPIDHSFLKYKKDLLPYGYQVANIAMKAQTVTFIRLPLDAEGNG